MYSTFDPVTTFSENHLKSIDIQVKQLEQYKTKLRALNSLQNTTGSILADNRYYR